jgi:hypothetical protein
MLGEVVGKLEQLVVPPGIKPAYDPSPQQVKEQSMQMFFWQHPQISYAPQN